MATWPHRRHDAADLVVRLASDWAIARAIGRGENSGSSSSSDVTICSLDGDCLRAVAAGLPVGPLPPRRLHATSLDSRSSSVVALASACSATHLALVPILDAMRSAHTDRLNVLDGMCRQLRTTLPSLRRNSFNIWTPGESVCTMCERWLPRRALFAHDWWPPEMIENALEEFRAAVNQALEEEGGAAAALPVNDVAAPAAEDLEEQGTLAASDVVAPADDVALVDDDVMPGGDEAATPVSLNATGRPEDGAARARTHLECAHCWREQLGLSMRPTEGVEQTWEAPIEEGTWRLVQDYSAVDDLDSPLLSIEECTGEVPYAWPIYAALVHAGYALSYEGTEALAPREGGAGVAMGSADAAEPDAEGNAEGNGEGNGPDDTGGLVPRSLLSPTRFADLLGSGYCDATLCLDLRGASLHDDDAALLFDALVGNALHLQFLDLSQNLALTDEGIGALAARLTPRRYELMLPLLRWLIIGHLPRVLGPSAEHLARAIDADALPMLELLSFVPPDVHNLTDAQVVNRTIEAFGVLEEATSRRGIFSDADWGL